MLNFHLPPCVNALEPFACLKIVLYISLEVSRKKIFPEFFRIDTNLFMPLLEIQYFWILC